ncbi:hypothetical protein V5F40_22730 [Xanthobacter sp. DSM 14520]|uniref:hypothetical protein n=1 Tax=Xanthobacter autotrophicus (strain ATCC BAA-1158 / Py2) TaxID=78245 RepID=UPI00372897FE
MLKLSRSRDLAPSLLAPGSSLGQTVMLDMARERAVAMWQQHMAALEATAERANAALAVAADPDAPMAQRQEAMGRASSYKHRLDSQWAGVQQQSKPEVERLFRDLAAGISGPSLEDAAGKLVADLRAPQALLEFEEAFASVEAAVLEALRHPLPELGYDVEHEMPRGFAAPTPF